MKNVFFKKAKIYLILTLMVSAVWNSSQEALCERSNHKYFYNNNSFHNSSNSSYKDKNETQNTDSPRIEATIFSVTDGDTIKVIVNGRKEKVRLIGIDAPESVDNERLHWQSEKSHKDLKTILSLGEESKRFLNSVLKEGDKVYLEADVEPRDRFGRMLAYVYTTDGSMINELILKNGKANMLTMPPNIRYVEKLRKYYNEGKRNQK